MRADQSYRRLREWTMWIEGPGTGGPITLQTRCMRIDSEGGPGGLLAGAADQSHSRPEVHGCSVIGYDMACYACMVYVVGILGISH